MLLCALSAVARADAASDTQRRAAVLASFQGGRITVGDMEDAVGNKLPQTRAELATADGRARFLRELVTYELLRLEAERRGYGGHAVVSEAVERASIERLMLQQFPLDPAGVPASELAAAYAAQSKKLDRKPERRASYIWIQTEAEARALLAKLRAGDRNGFGRLARERSKDERTRSRGGDLGYFDRDGRSNADGEPRVPRELASATFALKREGDVTRKPIPMQGGFAVLMWTGQAPGVHRTLAEAEPALREQLAIERQGRAIAAFEQERLKALAPELHPELSDSISLDPVRPLDIPSGFPAAPPDPAAPPILVAPDAI